MAENTENPAWAPFRGAVSTLREDLRDLKSRVGRLKIKAALQSLLEAVPLERKRLFIVNLQALAFLFLLLCCSGHGAAASDEFVPSFWDPHRRVAEPELPASYSLRFLTEDDYPPLHFALPDGTLTGFNVNLARAICEVLKITCTIQARRFDTLIDSLEERQGDAIIASIRIDPKTRERLDFTGPYYLTPGRFVTRAGSSFPDPTPESLGGKSIGVEEKSAHEAYLETYFPEAIRQRFGSQAALHDALRKGEIDAFFSDGLSSSLWLSGLDAQECCVFRGGPFIDPNFFGEGVGIAIRKGDTALRRALDYALANLAAKGVYTDLYLKYFPVGFY